MENWDFRKELHDKNQGYVNFKFFSRAWRWLSEHGQRLNASCTIFFALCKRDQINMTEVSTNHQIILLSIIKQKITRLFIILFTM